MTSWVILLPSAKIKVFQGQYTCIWSRLESGLTFSSDFSFPSALPLSSFGFPYHLSTSGWMNLCQINRNTGTRMHDIHTILKKESGFCLPLRQDFYRAFKDRSTQHSFSLVMQELWRMLFTAHRSHCRLSNGGCFGKLPPSRCQVNSGLRRML